ncbi:hypothetical protein [Halorubrum vacuolatum]|uniref:Uncharacterized protein n=1 Tax=Halorubrum vacuolatum TaxID=63740 RepID=A0A238XB23_HALVU|nr:hypothetical protein [Halorubrum vacuolatum]SNR55079.1 hypothetical protein SAMN06264855_11473 [Halorubrum vacuolatum]
MNGIRIEPVGVIQKLHQSEYTGENRCRVCTVLNACLAILIAVGVGVVSIPAAVIVLVFSAGVIALRGYLIPGTPTLVTYLPESVHDAIGAEHDITRSSGVQSDAEEPIDIETILLSANVVIDCPEEDDLCLTDAYRAAWDLEIGKLDDEAVRNRLATTLAVDGDEIELEADDDGLFVRIEGVRAGGWPSRPAFLADLTSQALLETWVPDWESLPPRDRTRLLAALRTFVDRCPDCGGDVVAETTVTRSCCRGNVTSVTTACADCNSTIFEGMER